MTGKVVWCDSGFIPYHYGFCPDEKAWESEVKRLGVPHLTYPTAHAMCTNLQATVVGKNACTIVTVNHEKRPALNIATLIVHEAMHVWRLMREDIGEESPSQEFEAYSIQSIAHHLLNAYEKTRGKLFR